MKGSKVRLSTGLAAILVVLACAPSETGSRADSRARGDSPGAAAAPKRISAAIMADLPSVRSQLSRAAGGTLPGAREIEQLLHAGLAVEDERGLLHPQLADAVPTLENSRWTLFPDGRMETTWTLRDGVLWHDGVPFTTEDLLFTARVARDKDFPLFAQLAYDSIEEIVALDVRTLLVRWSRPFIEADTLFAGVGSFQGLPLPKHILEQPSIDQRAAFTSLPYWMGEFIGAGPFRLQDWAMGSHAVLLANDRYVLGRPRIDEIQIRFISDPNTLVANLLAGAVELPIGRGLSFEQAMQMKEQWTGGQVEFVPGGAIKVWPQLSNPSPAIVGDVTFRRALMHAIDRQQLADTLMQGIPAVAHSILVPTDREWVTIEPHAVRYEYDPRTSLQLIESLGFRRGADGSFRDAAGDRPTVEIRATVIDILQKTVLAVAGDWQKVGIPAEMHTITPARQSDREYRARFPSFDTSRGNNSPEAFKTFLGSEARLPASQYAGLNYPSYVNADLDALINRYLVTIPSAERLQLGGQIVHHLSDRVVVMPMFYDVVGTMIGDRLIGIPTMVGLGRTHTWTAHTWDLKSS